MPVYEYRCQACGQPFEKMMRFTEASKTPACPYCQSKETKKQLSTFACRGESAPSASNCASSGRFT